MKHSDDMCFPIAHMSSQHTVDHASSFIGHSLSIVSLNSATFVCA